MSMGKILVQYIDFQDIKKFVPERTCHDITPPLLDGMPYPDTFTCSECGYKMEGVVYPNYCINCGAKVVE